MDRPISSQMSAGMAGLVVAARDKRGHDDAGGLSKAIDPTTMIDDRPRMKTLALVGKQ
ncbi:MAG: hypothetical protein ACLPKB_12040 [Xanthobacteraceae bacterium]